MGRLLEAVQSNPADLSGFLLPYFQVIASLQVPDLAGGDGQQVSGPERGIDTKDKQTVIARMIGQQFFDGPDTLEIADRLDLDRASLFRMVSRSLFHCSILSCFIKNINKT